MKRLFGRTLRWVTIPLLLVAVFVGVKYSDDLKEKVAEIPFLKNMF